MNVVESYAMRAETRDPECLIGPVLRTRSVAARDVLAHLATGGRLGYADLIRSVAVERALPQPIRDDAAHQGWLLSLARVMAAQSSDDADRTHALGIFDAVFDHSGADAFDANQQSVYAQLLVLEGKFGRADAVVLALTRLPDVVAEYLRADLASPFLRPGHGDIESWLAVLNGPVLRAGLEPIELLAEGPTPFDRLSASPRGTVADGPLVSVIMSAYRPDEALSHAVRSILEQTWTNLELIIVDDASGAGFADKLDACADLDPRVTVLRQAVNGGTYLARNAGLDHARGEFVTFQDSDDWSHPRRVEHQVAPLLSDPEVLASRSVAVRAHDDLSHQWLGYPAQRVNASSLLFRKDRVLARIGYFDSVRKSADFEFAFRLETAFKRRIRDVKEPLAVTRLRQSSLSRADFMLGWSAPARIAYQAAYREWHREIRGGADPYLPRVLTARPFPAPASYLKRIADAPQARHHYDVLLVDDWMPHAAPHDGALEEIATLRERGLVVGIVQAEAVGRMTARRKHLDVQIQRLVNAGTVDRLTLDDEVSADLVLVRDPAVLQFPQADPAALKVEQVVLAASLSRPDYPEVPSRYDEESCTDHARALFGREPRWDTVPSPVRLDRWGTPRARRRAVRPVIGRYAADTSVTWPDNPDELAAAYPVADELDVRILGGAEVAAKVLGQRTAPPTWLVYPRNQITLRAFLYQLDFFVYFPSGQSRFPPVDLLATALASGAVVVLPERFRDTFGPAAVYCSAEEVVDTVSRYHAQPELYRRQVEAGRDHVASAHAAADYAERIEKLIARSRV